MRFASLAVERYGHLDGCQLTFRSGVPDLHIIYGANEAGKTTSLAAISDLLFGFPVRSPYNFRFDYALLRVGAVLEEDGHSFACRRKKGTSGTLIDAQDNPLDEGPLLAMLRGQTRETFGLSFSLDHEGLRAGGRAMVNARDDAGRALFAAGSGMVGVSDALFKLEQEADAIWGPKAAQRRSFTQAQRELTEQARVARDQALKPRTWTEAKAALASTEAALAAAQERRDQLLGEVRRDERIRRIAPSVRIRAERLASLSDQAVAFDILPQRADAAEEAMGEIASAAGAKAAAEQLAHEAAERMESVSADPAILAQGELIDELVAAKGAIDKGLRDMARLQTDKEVANAQIARLRSEVGSLAADPPPRLVSSKLREIGLAHAVQTAALRQIEESEEALARRREEFAKREVGGGGRSDLEGLATAVDSARALGADADARCETTRRVADLATVSLNQALARLAPWTGDAQALLVLPRIPQTEIDAARSGLADLSTELAANAQAAQRSRDESARIALEMEQLASRSAVSSDDIATARSERALHWSPLREHVLSIVPLAAPEVAVAAFEAAVAHADDKSDLRFVAADESSRLTILGNRRATLLLEAKQADDRGASAREAAARMRREWTERLTTAGYPDLDPVSLVGWLADRDAAQAAAAGADQAAVEAEAARRRRDTSRADLAAYLASEPSCPTGTDLAPLLSFAERIRKAGDDAVQQRKLDQATLVQLDTEAAVLGRRRAQIFEKLQACAKDWGDLVQTLGITLNIADATAMLDLLDELRVAIADHAELQSRINGISRDARKHWESVDQTAFAVGITAGKNGPERLELLRSRLAEARSAIIVGKTLQESAAKRIDEASAADARLIAAQASLRPLMEETGAEDIAGLFAAIEASRRARADRDAIAAAEGEILANGDGYGLEELIATLKDVDTDSVAAHAETTAAELRALNAEVEAAATAQGDARRAFLSLEVDGGDAVDAAAAAEEARAELAVLSEQYILKRAQVVSLKWAIEQYRERHQDPMLLRASALFSTLTLGRYTAVRVDSDGSSLRLLGLRDDGRTLVDVGAMSEGTTDQLFLALRIASVEQSIAAGVRLPFLADDLFVNFDDDRSEAGLRVLAELAKSTQVLFFTHHAHLASIARSVVGDDLHSECALV
jgi:uncharacterized protein YhaN